MRSSRTLAPAALLAGLMLGACGGGGNSGPTITDHDAMTQAQADEVGGSIATLVAGAFSSVSKFQIDNGTLTDPTLAPGSTAARQQHLVAALLNIGAHASRSASLLSPALDGGILGGGSCNPVHTATQDSTYDTDHDGIPNDDILTFTATNCNYENADGLTVLVQGNIEIKDQGSIWGFQIDFNNLSYSLSSQNGSGSIIVSGLYSTTVAANLVTTSEGIHVSINNNTNGQSFGIITSWDVNFVPTSAIGIHATALPAGSMTITGNFSYSHNTDVWAVILSTPDPLMYDGSCAIDPVFASGSLEGQIAIKRTHGFHIQFQGCGEVPVVTTLGTT
jgi:hypothetical protein